MKHIFLTSSKFMKHILNLLFTIEKPTRPYKVFSNINKLKIHLEKNVKKVILMKHLQYFLINIIKFNSVIYKNFF